jgi:hypothetical protein
MTIRDLTPADVDGLAAFFGSLSEEDLTFIREDVHDRARIAQLPHTPDPRWMALDGTAVTGYATVERLPG